LRFLVDTNVLVSAVLFPAGKVSKVFSYLLETHDVTLCSFSIAEARAVFQRKFQEKSESLEQFLRSIEFSLFQTPEKLEANSFPKIRDIKDMPILASAILAGVDVLISGDKDFQDVEIDRPLIFTPAEYLDLIEGTPG